MSMTGDKNWPIYIQDKEGRVIYLSKERWKHALRHTGMSEALLPKVLTTVKTGKRKVDIYDPNKYKYIRSFRELPSGFTHLIVVVKFSLMPEHPGEENNFVLTAYLINRK